MLGVIGFICILFLFGSIWAAMTESPELPQKTDWSPETLAAVARKERNEQLILKVEEKHPDNPLSWTGR